MSDEELQAYSAALDEVYRLRLLMAMWAEHGEADLGYRTYPKSRRKIVEDRIEGQKQAARGHSELVLAGENSYQLKQSLKRAGASDMLTRAQWEESLPKRELA